MKKFMLLAAVFALFAGTARADIITYSWHQTSTTWPGLVFDAWYKIIPGGAHQPDQLIGLYVQGDGYPAINLASLVPPCWNPSGCNAGGAPHAYGFPIVYGSPPYLTYINAYDLDDYPYHVEWEYILSPTSILIGDDNGGKRCWDTDLCTAYGFWDATVFAPEPWTLAAFGGGLALVQLSLATRRKRRGKG